MHVSEIYKTITKNPTILYRGYSKTFAKVVISAPLFFPLQEELTKQTGSNIIGSIMAATIGTTCMQPFDYLKNRQIYGNSLYNTPGIKIYFRGLSLNLFRVVPHFTIIMYTTQFLESLNK